MRTIIICDDCGKCCGEENKIKDIKLREDAHLIKSKCLGVCPENKISTVVLDSKQINDFKIVPLTVNEINNL